MKYITIFRLQAITTFKQAKGILSYVKRDKYRCYNNLGKCYRGLASNMKEERKKNYKQAIECYKEALKYATVEEKAVIDDIIGDCYYEIVFITFYHEIQKEYKDSINYLENSIKNKNLEKEKIEKSMKNKKIEKEKLEEYSIKIKKLEKERVDKYKKLGVCYNNNVLKYIFILNSLIMKKQQNVIEMPCYISQMMKKNVKYLQLQVNVFLLKYDIYIYIAEQKNYDDAIHNFKDAKKYATSDDDIIKIDENLKECYIHEVLN